jgi:hypothetical protein
VRAPHDPIDTLASAANQRARVLVDTDQQRLYYEWPEGVISHALVPGLATEQGSQSSLTAPSSLKTS